MSMSPRSMKRFAIVATALSLACQEVSDLGGGGGGSGTPVATSLIITPDALNLTGLGESQQLTATVRDQNGTAMSGQTITWSTADSAVATVNVTGLVTAVANGMAAITAASGSLNAFIDATVAQAPGQMSIASGDAQMATVGVVLPDSLVAVVADNQGNVLDGTSVTFLVTQGGGTVAPDTVVSDSTGRVAAQWALGTTAGIQTVLVRPVAGPGSALFNATANPDVADTVFSVSGDAQSQQNGSLLTDPLVLKVTDQYGNAIDGFSIDFDIQPGGTGTVNGGTTHATATDSAGEASANWTLGPEVGTQTVDATAGGLKGSPVTFSATSLSTQPGSLVLDSGDAQTGLVGFALNAKPRVQVLDLAMNPFPGATVEFVVTSGGGSVTSGSAISDVSGFAEVGWVLGAGAGTNTLEARVVGTDTVTFSATGQVAAYDIEVRFINTPTAGQQAAFDSAEAKWERIIYGDLPSQPTGSLNPGWCGASTPAIDETVDDIIIYAELKFIDGPFNILGQAAPCAFRAGSSLPVLGIMVFDTSDLTNLANNGQLDDVILHEMGHVLGVGTLWDNFGFLELPSDTAPAPIVDTHFDGPLGLAAFEDIGGSNYNLGNKVPVENDNGTFGFGSLNGHWRESVVNTEIMSPSINGGVPNPLSVLTVASIADLGYVSNYGAADTYVLPVAPFFGSTRVSGVGVQLVDDIWRGPIMVLDPTGRITKVIKPR